MSYTALRIYDEKRNRTVCASPNVYTVWDGNGTQGRCIAGPIMLNSSIPHSEDDLWDCYNAWREAGEPGTNELLQPMSLGERQRSGPVEPLSNDDVPRNWEPQSQFDIQPEA